MPLFHIMVRVAFFEKSEHLEFDHWNTFGTCKTCLQKHFPNGEHRT